MIDGTPKTGKSTLCHNISSTQQTKENYLFAWKTILRLFVVCVPLRIGSFQFARDAPDGFCDGKTSNFASSPQRLSGPLRVVESGWPTDDKVDACAHDSKCQFNRPRFVCRANRKLHNDTHGTGKLTSITQEKTYLFAWKTVNTREGPACSRGSEGWPPAAVTRGKRPLPKKILYLVS